MKPTDFDRWAGDYNRSLGRQTRLFSSDDGYFAAYKVDIVRARLPKAPESILEFGCGIGRNIPFLRAAFPSAAITGSDVSARSLEVARAENHGASFWLENGEERMERQFDLIFVAGVFHHIPPRERRDIVDLLTARLKPDGTLFVFEHNPYNPVTRRIVDACPYDGDAMLLRPGELGRLLRDGGLAVTGRGFALFVPPRLRALLPLERYLAWLPLGGQYWLKARR